METKIAVFHSSKIRRVMHNNEWWFSVVDVCGVLVDSQDAGAYWRKLKQRLINEEGSQVVTNCHGLKLPATDGKMRGSILPTLWASCASSIHSVPKG